MKEHACLSRNSALAFSREGSPFWANYFEADRAASQPHRVGGAHEGREHQPGVDRRVEELVEVIVDERLAA